MSEFLEPLGLNANALVHNWRMPANRITSVLLRRHTQFCLGYRISMT